MVWNNNYIKATKECLIKYFTFYYNSAYRVHKDAKCYRPRVISVTVTKGGHLRGSRLYGTSKTIGRGVSQVT